jgi:hypothetical protein
MTKLVDDPCDDSEAALVLARRSTRLAARDPSLVGAKTDAKQIGLSLLAYRRQCRFQPAGHFIRRLVLTNGLALCDTRKKKPHLLKSKAELATSLRVVLT